MRFPSIRNVASALRGINSFAYDECDVRLQVYPDGQWSVRYGDASYDQDHTGYWGASCVPGNNKRFHSYDLARDLIDQCKEDHAMSNLD